MRNYILLLTPLVDARRENERPPRCTLPDLQAMATASNGIAQVEANGDACMQALAQPITAEGILTCLRATAGEANNRCIDCIIGSVSPQILSCLVNCGMGIQTTGCDTCQKDMMFSALGNCMPPGVGGLLLGMAGNSGQSATNGTDLSQLFGGITGIGGGRHHHHGSAWGPEVGLRCSLRDMKKILPRGSEDMETFVDCVGNLPTMTESWDSCFPLFEEVISNSNCTSCVSDLVAQVQVGCSTACTGTNVMEECKNCIKHTASMGFGLCTGVAEPPIQPACSAADVSLYTNNNGETDLLACLNQDGPMASCIEQSRISSISSSCRSCLIEAPTWSSAQPSSCNCTLSIPSVPTHDNGGHGVRDSQTPAFVCDESCAESRPPVDSVSVDGCFDPNGFRRPGDTTPEFGINETVALMMPACSIDDAITLSDAATTVTSCLGSSDPESCIAAVNSANVTCTQCVSATIPTTCDDADCWDQSLSTSVGSCMYSGFPVSFLASEGEATTPAPKSAAVTSVAVTFAASLVMYLLH